jgi:UDPglucose 6-dehydrogenase
VPVGTGEEIEAIIRNSGANSDFAVVSNPDSLREGTAIDDFLHPDRVVIGAEDKRSLDIVRSLYEPLAARGTPIVTGSRRTAELIKYAANALLATKIAFVGEVADLCERAGADIEEVAHGLGLETRIGTKFLRAGPGYDGSCFPKDTLALLATAHQHGAELRILRAVVTVNQARKLAMVDKIVEACEGSIRGRTVAVLGLTFKPETDDVRESASLSILPELERRGAHVRAYDPAGMTMTRSPLPMRSKR